MLGSDLQTTGTTTTNYSTQQYQYQYQYQMPTTTTTTTTQQYTTQPVTYTTQQFAVPDYTQSYTTQQETYTTTVPQTITTSIPQTITTSIPQTITTTTSIPQTYTTQQTYTTSAAQYASPVLPAPIKPQPAFRLLRQGSGISPHEQQAIVTTAMMVYMSGISPISNNTASRIKKSLGGDWIVIVYAQGKPVDFNMTCVQGNDYMYFTLDNTAYQVCRLR
jgi:hypothetical protein